MVEVWRRTCEVPTCEDEKCGLLSVKLVDVRGRVEQGLVGPVDVKVNGPFEIWSAFID